MKSMDTTIESHERKSPMIKKNGRHTVEILLVEDNPGDERLAREAFEEGKYAKNIHVVPDGEEAMSYLKREGKYANAVCPDLILMDLNLPRRDGREVVATVKSSEELKKIPVIVLTTSESESDIHRMYNLHANCYIIKPVDLNEFFKVIKMIEDFWLGAVRLP